MEKSRLGQRFAHDMLGIVWKQENEKVGQVTLNGHQALRKNQAVLYISERAVFKLTAKGPELVAYAPGVDIQKNILDLIPFPIIVNDPVEMDADLFI